MITSSLNIVIPKEARYNTFFTLYPRNTQAPSFANYDPYNNFFQRTWISQILYDINNNRSLIYQYLNVNNSRTISMVEGTEFEIDIQAYDPTNIGNTQNDSNIQYRWKRDGSTLYEFSTANNMMGQSRLYIGSGSCTRDISGEYTLDATNRYGTTTSPSVIIDVINLKQHPKLYKNLLVNGCGEMSLENWTSDSDITVKHFSTNNRNQASIPIEIYSVNYTSPYTKDFRFSFNKNETKLSTWFNLLQTPSTFNIPNDPGRSSYNKWIITNFKPCLVATDGSDSINVAGPHESFFPSWNYVDKYNKNDKLVSLENIISKHKTYITRGKIKFAKYGGKPKSIAYQTIDVSDASAAIDGEVYGVNNIIAHFFAYIGIGISTYKIQYTNLDNEIVTDNIIPTSFYDFKVGSLTDKPPFIPLHPLAGSLENGVTSYDTNKRNKFATSIKPQTRINIIPVCYDVTSVRLDFLDSSDQLIQSTDIPGPSQQDIWAVKEKFFMPIHIANLYGWCTTADRNDFWINDQPYTTLNAILQSSTDKDLRIEYVKQNIYPLITDKWDFARRTNKIENLKPLSPDATIEEQEEYNLKRNLAIEKYGFNQSFIEINGETNIPLWSADGLNAHKYDQGAAAFFGINQNIIVPVGTRSIRVNVIFNHTSDAMFDENPRSKGWIDQTIYYDIFSKAESSERLYDYGNPRCGITAMHLSLHPNIVKVSEEYNTYYTHVSGSVWGSELQRLSSRNEQFSLTPKTTPNNTLRYIYSVSTIPVDYTYVGQEPLNINDLDQVAGSSAALTVITSSYSNTMITSSTFVEDFGAIGEILETTGSQIVVSGSELPPNVPDIVGYTRLGANTLLRDQGFIMIATSGSYPNDILDVGRVESQTPVAGAIRPGDSVVRVAIYLDFNGNMVGGNVVSGSGSTGGGGGGGNRPGGPQ